MQQKETERLVRVQAISKANYAVIFFQLTISGRLFLVGQLGW